MQNLFVKDSFHCENGHIIRAKEFVQQPRKYRKRDILIGGNHANVLFI
jgi:hypothetical protein